MPLGDMPLIDIPFRRVAIDLFGPISPPSEKGHRYILILVDYMTRYLEAVPLKNIETETVAGALLDMSRRLGIPEEVLSDLGTQFVSKCMEEVSRLLSIKRLITTPYHPICNGLVERFNPIRHKWGNNCLSNFLLSTALSTMTLQYQDFMTIPKNNSICF